MAVFAAHGYERVEPPLIEFEESLFSGAGHSASANSFRVMDPISRRMMGLRQDMTPQVARIAASRLRDAPRPLRLAYGGTVLRVQGTQLRPDRQTTQVGFELVGQNGTEALGEVVLVALDALEQLDIGPVTLDLVCPALVPALCEAAGLDPVTAERVREALGQKDLKAVETLVPAGQAAVFTALARAMGPVERAVEVLESLALPAQAAVHRDALLDMARRVLAFIGSGNVTVDPFEFRGFEYKTGPAFSFFARGARGELGRGGAYVNSFGGVNEPCCGVSLYLETLVEITGRSPECPRILVDPATSLAGRRALQDKGFVTVTSPGAPLDGDEARRLNCARWLSPEGDIRDASPPPVCGQAS